MYDREPLYVISVAARLLNMHAQTLRKYEREEFIKPSRTQGRLRLYSAEDIERLRQIKHLVEYVGLNLAGVQLALEMSQRLDALRDGVREADSQEAATALVEQEIHDLLLALGVPDGPNAPVATNGAGDDERGEGGEERRVATNGAGDDERGEGGEERRAAASNAARQARR